jgi:hypothetical protein
MADPRQNPAIRGRRGWNEQAAAVPRAKSRRRRLFGVLLAIGTLLGVLVALLLLFRVPRPPAALSIPVTGYDQQYPVNALARADSDSLLELFADPRQAADRQERQLLRDEFDALQSRPANGNLLVHLVALARTDATRVYLLPADADPDAPSGWLSLDEILTSLRRCPARRKVLLLDIARPCADPRLGILTDDVAGRLPPLLKDAVEEDPGLFVLLPCSPGQVALTSDDLGQSVFGHYLAEGLRGRAAGYNRTGNVGSTVTLEELARYVTAHVDRWARQNRGTRQTPLLLAKDPDQARRVDLAVIRRAGGGQEPAAAESPSYPGELTKGWQLRDRWRLERAFEAAPQAFRDLGATLAHAEQQWRGRNVAAADIESHFQHERTELEKQMAEALRGIPVPEGRPSLAVAAALGEQSPDRKASDALRDLAREVVSAKDQAAADMLRPKIEAARKPFQDRPFALGWVAFEAAREDVEIDPARLRFYAGFQQPADQSEPRFAETLLLRRLAELQPDRRTKKWPQVEAQLALKAARVGEKAIACQAERRRDKVSVPVLEPRALPWVEKVLPAATRHRRDGERLLFGGDAKTWDQARDALGQAVQEYEAALTLIQAVAEAHEVQQDAWAFLPEFAVYYLASPQPEASAADWDEAVRRCLELSALLARPTEQVPATRDEVPATVDELRKRVRDLRRPLDGLRRRVPEAIDALRPERRGGHPKPAEAEALLNSSLLTPQERVTLRGLGRELAQDLNKQTLDEDQAENAQHPLLPPGDPDVPALERDERRRAVRRARCLIDLLKVAGLAGVDKLEQEAKALGPDGRDATPQAWQSLGERLREACTLKLATQVKERLTGVTITEEATQVPAGLVAADRLSRGIHPFDLVVLKQRALMTDRAPAPRLRAEETRLLWRWLGDRYGEEDRPQAPPEVRDFYSRAAEDYQRAAHIR